MIYRVLVVDDYEPWRRYVESALRASPRWQVVGEAADGVDAVHKAQVFRPDLILLDIGLPVLNGIEAARQILALDADRRILFLSEHRSWAVVEAALGTGGSGYVLKFDAGRDLLSAMEAVVEGQRFISRSLTGFCADASIGLLAPPRAEESLQSRAPKGARMATHPGNFADSTARRAVVTSYVRASSDKWRFSPARAHAPLPWDFRLSAEVTVRSLLTASASSFWE